MEKVYVQVNYNYVKAKEIGSSCDVIFCNAKLCMFKVKKKYSVGKVTDMESDLHSGGNEPNEDGRHTESDSI